MGALHRQRRWESNVDSSTVAVSIEFQESRVASDSQADFSAESQAPPQMPRRRRVLRHVAAAAFGLAVVIGLELICRLAGWGDPNLTEDPFVGFAGTRSLFIKSDDQQRYIVPRVREEYFARESFPVEKPDRTRRIFCLGGSTVQGRPWSIPTSFSTWLELALNRIDENHDWDVINCGGISYASYRLVPILEECLQYEPDLIILCTGHNEFLEDRSYSDLLRSPLLQRSSQLRLVNLARTAIDRWSDTSDTSTGQDRPTLALETEPMLNFEGGLDAYHRDDPWRPGVASHFEVNLRRMIAMVRAAGLPLLLISPASNLRDCPPFKWELPARFDPEEAETWQQLMEAAQSLMDQNPLEALKQLEHIRQLDPEHPLTHYRLGQTHLKLRDVVAAREEFIIARDLDVCPLRITSPLLERLAEVAADNDVPLLDMQTVLEARTRDGILGDQWLVDHIHPSIEGHQRIAEAIVGQLEALGLITTQEGWQRAAQTAFDAHLATLDSAYFLRGQRMLEGLRAWSQGRADGPAAAERFPARVARPGE